MQDKMEIIKAIELTATARQYVLGHKCGLDKKWLEGYFEYILDILKDSLNDENKTDQ